jgi:hypothetical protein
MPYDLTVIRLREGASLLYPKITYESSLHCTVRPETTVIYDYVSYDLFFILDSDSFSLFYHCILHNLLIITE